MQCIFSSCWSLARVLWCQWRCCCPGRKYYGVCLMKLKRVLISLSAAGLTIGSLSLAGCGSGSSSPLSTTVPTPTAMAESAPAGYSFPIGGTTDNASTVYITSDQTGNLLNLALPLSPGLQPLVINAPGSVPSSSVTSAILQQFSGSAAPTVIVTSGTESATIVHISTSSLFGSSANAQPKADAIVWNSYSFFNMFTTAIPIGVAENNGAYLGINTTKGDAAGSFLAFQNSTSSETAVSVPGATTTACSVAANSTYSSAIAGTTLSNGTYIAIGTNNGEVMIYGVTDSDAGMCKNLTNAAKAQAVYNLGSKINELSFSGTASANYGYFGTSSNQVWRIVATTANVPQSFTQIAGSGSTFTSLPAGNVTALFSDANNNVYVGSSNGSIYALAPTNSAGGVNTTWTSVSLGDQPILSISQTSGGSIYAVTANGGFFISFNGS